MVKVKNFPDRIFAEQAQQTLEGEGISFNVSLLTLECLVPVAAVLFLKVWTSSCPRSSLKKPIRF